MTFKKKYGLEKRKEESKKILEKYPERIPVIVEKDKKSRISEIDKNKFLTPQDLTLGQFLYVIRKRIKINPEDALYCFVNNSLPPTSVSMISLYDSHKDEDGFLYITYCSENTFG